MGSIEYRLGELRIKEGILGELSWDSHFGFAEYREGRCFRKGRILFFGNAVGHEIGFLKGEFLDSLRNLPQWTKTEYYCLTRDLVSCGAGQKATETAIRRWCELSRDEEVTRTLSGESAVAVYQFGKYQVNIGKDGPIQYQTYTGNRLVTVRLSCSKAFCFWAKRKQHMPVWIGSDSFAELKKFPKWEKTEFFSFSSLLKNCAAANAAPLKKVRGRRTLAEMGSTRDTRKEEQSTYYSFDYAERLTSNFVKTASVVFKCLVVVIGCAAKALLFIMAKLSRWAWASKKLTGR